jgi:hypothetical protein
MTPLERAVFDVCESLSSSLTAVEDHTAEHAGTLGRVEEDVKSVILNQGALAQMLETLLGKVEGVERHLNIKPFKVAPLRRPVVELTLGREDEDR